MPGVLGVGVQEHQGVSPQVLGAVSAFLKQAPEGDNGNRAQCVPN